MALIRRTEKAAYDLFMSGEVKGTTHLAAGHEAVAVGDERGLARGRLRVRDLPRSRWRARPRRLAGRAPWPTDGEGSTTRHEPGPGRSMHLIDFDAGVGGSSGIVGSHLPIALGAARSAKLRGTGRWRWPSSATGPPISARSMRR